MEKKLLKIGLTVLLKPTAYNPYLKSKGVIRTEIEYVGRKYFNAAGRKFEIASGIEAGINSEYRVFLSEKDLIQSGQKKELLYKISKSFRGFYTAGHKDTSLEDLRIVAKLLKID